MLCHEIFGANATMREAADYYAEEGYTVLVPDLFWRQAPGIELGYAGADAERAMALYREYDENKGVEDVGATLAVLRQLPECTGGTGVLGYCLGGKLAYLAACRLPDVAAAVSYYGVGIEHALDEASHLHGRLVLQIAGQDRFCPPDAQQRIADALAGRDGVEVYVYPGSITRSRVWAAIISTRPPRAWPISARSPRSVPRSARTTICPHCGKRISNTNSTRAMSTPRWRRWLPNRTSTIFRR